MKFYEKYPQLEDKSFLSRKLTSIVFSTMDLENQQIPKTKIVKIVATILKEKELKGDQFFAD
jgi:hypothetical protein